MKAVMNRRQVGASCPRISVIQKDKNVGCFEDKAQIQTRVGKYSFLGSLLLGVPQFTALTATETTVSIGVCEEHCVERLAVSLAQ